MHIFFFIFPQEQTQLNLMCNFLFFDYSLFQNIFISEYYVIVAAILKCLHEAITYKNILVLCWAQLFKTKDVIS